MTLRSVFDDPGTTTRDAHLLASRAGVTLNSAKAFLSKQSAAQTMRQHQTPPLAAFAPSGDVYGAWLGDTIYLRDLAGVNSHRGAIFTIIEVNSRYAYCRAIVMMASAKERGVSSAKVAAAMKSILEQNAADVAQGKVAPILAMRTDGGPEHSGEFRALLKSHNIPLEQSEAGTHERLGRIDVFHRSLRRLLGDQFARTNSDVWYGALDALVDNYNSRPNRGLLAAGAGPLAAPIDIDQGLEEVLRDDDLRRAREVRERTDQLEIEPGKTKVRLLTRRMKASGKDRFRKAHELVWSDKLFLVLSRHGPNSFIIDVPAGEITIWPVHSIQVVDGKLDPTPLPGPRVKRKAVAAARLEYLNRDGVEQAAALAAPAREKRESVLTPKMAALKAAEASKLAKAKAALAATGLPKAASIFPDVEAKPGEPRRSQRLLSAKAKK